MAEKICGKCNKLKDLEDFHLDNSNKDGRQGTCKACRKKYNAKSPRGGKIKMATLVLKTFEEEYPVEYKRVIEKINERNTERSLA